MKAQSAIEYLITYSWAIIIITITLGAIYALGLFNPNYFISNQCIFHADFGCLSAFLYANGLVTVNIQQSTSSPINITGVGCNIIGNSTNMTTYTGANQIYLPIGSNVTLSAQCYSNGTVFVSQPGTLYKGYFVISYTNLQVGFTHLTSGQLIEKST